MKKILIVALTGIMIGVLFQSLFPGQIHNHRQINPSIVITSLLLYADPVYLDSDTVTSPTPVKPPPPIR